MWDLVSRPGLKPRPPCIESVVLATGPSGKSPDGEELLTAEMKTGTQTLGESLRKKGAGEIQGRWSSLRAWAWREDPPVLTEHGPFLQQWVPTAQEAKTGWPWLSTATLSSRDCTSLLPITVTLGRYVALSPRMNRDTAHSVKWVFCGVTTQLASQAYRSECWAVLAGLLVYVVQWCCVLLVRGFCTIGSSSESWGHREEETHSEIHMHVYVHTCITHACTYTQASKRKNNLALNFLAVKRAVSFPWGLPSTSLWACDSHTKAGSTP